MFLCVLPQGAEPAVSLHPSVKSVSNWVSSVQVISLGELQKLLGRPRLLRLLLLLVHGYTGGIRPLLSG